MNRKLLESIFEENRLALVVTNTTRMEHEQQMQGLEAVRELIVREFERQGWPLPTPRGG